MKVQTTPSVPGTILLMAKQNSIHVNFIQFHFICFIFLWIIAIWRRYQATLTAVYHNVFVPSSGYDSIWGLHTVMVWVGFVQTGIFELAEQQIDGSWDNGGRKKSPLGLHAYHTSKLSDHRKLQEYNQLEPHHDKTSKMSVRPAKTQISLVIRPVWSESPLRAQWVAKDPRLLHADSKYSINNWADAQADLSLRWAHTHFVGFVMSRLISFLFPFQIDDASCN